MTDSILKGIEIEYIELTKLAKHEPPSEEVMKRCEVIQKELNLTPCNQCEGQGGINLPSMMGYGHEWGSCKKCKGVGELGMSHLLQEEMEALFKEDEDPIPLSREARQFYADITNTMVVLNVKGYTVCTKDEWEHIKPLLKGLKLDYSLKEGEDFVDITLND